MALQDFIILPENQKKIGVSEERVTAVLPILGKYVGFWREYPDLFVDFLCSGKIGEENPDPKTFHMFFYQRVFLRAIARHQYVYATYPRGFSKSFLTVLLSMIRCILYPGIQVFVTAGGKEQGASILHDKVVELCSKIPALEREIDWRRGKTKEGKDKVVYLFKNGSILDNLAATERTRGQRRHAGVMEECVGIDGKILQEVIIPVMAIPRKGLDGIVHEEPVSKSQVYITTAGWKNTFPYDRLISTLVRSVTQPDRAIILGGTWRLPVEVGLQQRSFIQDQIQEGTYNEASFGREYRHLYSLNFMNCWEPLRAA